MFIASWVEVRSAMETGRSPWAERYFFEMSRIISRESAAGDFCPERADIKPWRLRPIDENCWKISPKFPKGLVFGFLSLELSCESPFESPFESRFESRFESLEESFGSSGGVKPKPAMRFLPLQFSSSPVLEILTKIGGMVSLARSNHEDSEILPVKRNACR